MTLEDVMADLAGKTAVVTGASRGIGEASARALDELGAQVVLSGRTVSDLERVASDLSNSPVVIPADLSETGRLLFRPIFLRQGQARSSQN